MYPIRTTRMSNLVAMTALTALATFSTAEAQQPVVVQQPTAAPTGYVVQQPQVIYQQQPQVIYQQQPQVVYQQPQVAQAPQAAAQPQPATGGDAYGFTGWLNSVRAQYGLPAVGYDPNLESWAAANNAQQQARGMGHHVMGPARRQNSAMGAYGSIGSMWMASPAHRAALLDPTIRFIGIAGAGAYWTFNAY